VRPVRLRMASRPDPSPSLDPPPLDLAAAFQALANPTRVAMLAELRQPATPADLARRFGITRQAVRKHLDALQEAQFVVRGPSPRMLKAHRYATNPLALHVFKETVWGLGGFSPPLRLPPLPTPTAPHAPSGSPPTPHGLVLVHGDAPGRWFPLDPGREHALGRADACDIVVPNDLYASGRHAHLAFDGRSWRVTDLGSRNGTWVDFLRVPQGSPAAVAPGQVLTVGRTHFVVRGA